METFPKKEQQFQDMSQRKNRLWLGQGGGGCSRHLGKLRAGRRGCNPGTNFFLLVEGSSRRAKLSLAGWCPRCCGYSWGTSVDASAYIRFLSQFYWNHCKIQTWTYLKPGPRRLCLKHMANREETGIDCVGFTAITEIMFPPGSGCLSMMCPWV